MTIFTVRATVVGGESGAVGWTFASRDLAEKQFKKVCGPLSTEVWLLRWTANPHIHGGKVVHLEQHWTFKLGNDSTQKLLAKVKVLEDSDALAEFGLAEPRVLAVTERGDGVSDILLNLVRSQSAHNLREFEFDFDFPADDSKIHVFVDPKRIEADERYASFELAFVKVGSRKEISAPDRNSRFSGLRLACQFDVGIESNEDDQTYGWRADYQVVGAVDLRSAQRMVQMLRTIQEIEETFPFKPKSFGEYVVITAERFGLNPASMGCLETSDSAQLHGANSSKYVCLGSSELRIAIDEAVASWIQTHCHLRKRRLFVVSDDPTIVEVVPRLFEAKGCDAVGSLSIRNGSWAYEKVLAEAADFGPNILFLYYNNHLCPKVDDLDLPSRLLRRFLFANVIITKVGNVVSVRDEVLQYLENSGRTFHIVDVPFEVNQVLSLIENNSE